MLPDFLIIGSAKSATTSLQRYVSQHPDIETLEQSTHFFSYCNDDAVFNSPGDNPDNFVRSLEEYSFRLSKLGSNRVVGEKCPSYLYHPMAAKNLVEVVPNVKLIAILRDPIDRAFSAYRYLISTSRETAGSFTEALELEQGRIQENWFGPLWHYVNAGFYGEQLSRYYELFPASQIKIFLYEDLKDSPNETLVSAFEFLGVSGDFRPRFKTKHNKSSGRLSRLWPAWFEGILSSWRRALPKHLRQRLMETYSEDICKLEKIIDRDLSAWKTV